MKIHPRGGVKEGNGETRGAIGRSQFQYGG